MFAILASGQVIVSPVKLWGLMVSSIDSSPTNMPKVLILEEMFIIVLKRVEPELAFNY
jgi:hypothetical protein